MNYESIKSIPPYLDSSENFNSSDSLKIPNKFNTTKKLNSSTNISKNENRNRSSDKINYSNLTYKTLNTKPLNKSLKEQNPPLKNFYFSRMMSKKLLEEAGNESQFINARINNINEKNKQIREEPKITSNYTNVSHEYISKNDTVDTLFPKHKVLKTKFVDKHNTQKSDKYKKTSEDVLYNLLDSQYSVNSPSKKRIYQHELDILKMNEEIRNRLIMSTENPENTETQEKINNDFENAKSKDTINLSNIGDNTLDKFLEAFETYVSAKEASLFNSGIDDKIELILESTEDPRRMFR